MSKEIKPRRPQATPEQMAERRRLNPARIEYIADLMRNLQFRTGKTAKACSVEWDLPYDYVVKEITVPASRIVRGEMTDHDCVLSKVSVALDRVIDEAIEKGDRASIIKAAQVWAQVTGAGAATRVQVQGDLTSMTPDQLKARKAEIIARLTGAPPAKDE